MYVCMCVCVLFVLCMCVCVASTGRPMAKGRTVPKTSCAHDFIPCSAGIALTPPCRLAPPWSDLACGRTGQPPRHVSSWVACWFRLYQITTIDCACLCPWRPARVVSRVFITLCVCTCRVTQRAPVPVPVPATATASDSSSSSCWCCFWWWCCCRRQRWRCRWRMKINIY